MDERKTLKKKAEKKKDKIHLDFKSGLRRHTDVDPWSDTPLRQRHLLTATGCATLPQALLPIYALGSFYISMFVDWWLAERWLRYWALEPFKRTRYHIWCIRAQRAKPGKPSRERDPDSDRTQKYNHVEPRDASHTVSQGDIFKRYHICADLKDRDLIWGDVWVKVLRGTGGFESLYSVFTVDGVLFVERFFRKREKGTLSRADDRANVILTALLFSDCAHLRYRAKKK